MKIIIYLFSIVVLISCVNSNKETEKDSEQKISENKAPLVLDSNKKTYVDSIWQLSKGINFKCETSPTKIINGDEWTNCQIKNNLEIVSISKVEKNILYTEQYLLKNSKLIYAVEWEKRPANVDDKDASFWNCQYIIKDKSVVDYISLGMGKTEGDSFNAEDIITLWNSHRAGYKNIKTNANTI